MMSVHMFTGWCWFVLRRGVPNASFVFFPPRGARMPGPVDTGFVGFDVDEITEYWNILDLPTAQASSGNMMEHV